MRHRHYEALINSRCHNSSQQSHGYLKSRAKLTEKLKYIYIMTYSLLYMYTCRDMYIKMGHNWGIDLCIYVVIEARAGTFQMITNVH